MVVDGRNLKALDGGKPLNENELKEVACRMYCTMPTPKLDRIAVRVGKPKSVIEQWRDDGHWRARRDQVLNAVKQDGLEEAAKLLQDAGVMSARECAIDTLKLCKAVRGITSGAVNRKANPEGVSQASIDASWLEKLVGIIERIHKLEQGAHQKLGI